MARILLTGGSGRLGRALQACMPGIIAPSHADLDVTDRADCMAAISDLDPDIVIHAAGYVDSVKAETDREACWKANVKGTEQMMQAASWGGRRFVYVSTDYVFDGVKGDYRESDAPNPINFYGVTKLAGEMIVSQYPNTLILRAPFREDPPWKYPKAFDDQWTSCDFVSKRAPQIIKAALMEHLKGVLHIGGARLSIYEMAKSVSPEVAPISRKWAGLSLPADTSLNSSKWLSLQNQSAQSSRVVAISN